MIVTFGEWLLARGYGSAQRDAPPAGARGPWTQEWRWVASTGQRGGWSPSPPSHQAIMGPGCYVESRWVSVPVKEGGR